MIVKRKLLRFKIFMMWICAKGNVHFSEEGYRKIGEQVTANIEEALAELLDNSFRKVEEVEQFLDAAVLATIPGIDSIKGKVKVR